MIVREATHSDVSAMAQVHVDTWRTTYQGIVPDEFLANLSYEKRENSWHQVLENAPNDGSFTLQKMSQVKLSVLPTVE
jgi:hypothetical protein